ncbi:MAG: DnaA/Hda family protein [Pseudomonadales bacterium]
MTGSRQPPGTASAATAAQLALRFPLTSRYHFDTFEVGSNAELVRRVLAVVDEPGFQGCFIDGPPGVGRTHLLQAACHRFADPGGAIYLPLREVTPALLEGLSSRGLVALDDLDAWLGDDAAEAALVALYQGLLGNAGRLLVSARAPARELGFRFADLASRLRGLPAYHLQGLDDAGKRRVLARLAAARGLALTPAVLDFWLARSARDLAHLLEEFERLDRAAMAEQRRITVPLIKNVLGL